MANICAVKSNTGASIIPVTDGDYFTDEMSLDYATCIITVDFFADASGTTPATATAGTISVYAAPGNVYGATPEIISAAKVSAGTQDQVVITGPVKRIKVTTSGIVGAAYARIAAWRSAEYEADPAASSGEPQPVSIVDYAGKGPSGTVFGDLVTGERSDNVNVQFQYRISSIDTLTTVSGTGTTSHSQGIAQVESGTGVGSARIESKSTIRYIPGHEVVIHFTADFSAAQSGVVQRAGTFDTANGAYFKSSGIDFGVAVLKGGVETFIPQSSWSHDKADGTGESGLTLDPTHYNIYRITYGWLGIAPIQFSVYGGQSRGWVLLHSYDLTNVGEGPHVLDPTLPVAVQIDRASGSGTNAIIKTSSWNAGIVGRIPSGSLIDRPWTTFVGAKSISAGVLTPIITLRNRTTFNGLVNHVRLRYATVALASDGTKNVVWYVYRGATLTGAVFANLNTNESVAELDTTATAISGGTLVGGTVMQKAADTRINLVSGDVVIAAYPGETITLAAQSVNASTVDVFLRWIEEF